MKKTTKLVLMSVLVIALCVSLIAGATFALFTSDVSTDIDVTSGTVQLDTEVTLTAWSAKWNDEQNGYVDDYKTISNNSAKFSAGGLAFYDGTALTLERIVAGDGVKLSVAVTNSSNVFIKYRLVLGVEGDLIDGLQIGCAKDGSALILSEAKNYLYSEWFETDDETATNLCNFDVTIQLPIDTDNAYQGKSCNITVTVFAVQLNGHVADTLYDKEAIVLNNDLLDRVSALGFTAKTLVVGSWDTYADEVGRLFSSGQTVSATTDNVKAFEVNGKVYVLSYGKIVTETSYNKPLFAQYDYKEVVLSDVDFSALTSMANVFTDSSIESIDFSGANLTGLTSLQSAFFASKDSPNTILKSVNFSKADLSNVTSTRTMFYCYTGLETADFSETDFTNNQDMYGMFAYCSGLETADFSYATFTKVSNVSLMFGYTSNLRTADFSHVDLSQVKSISNGMFFECSSLESVDFQYANLSGLSSLYNVFYSNTVYVSSLGASQPINRGLQLKSVNFSHANLSGLTSLKQAFNYLTKLQTVDFSYADLSRIEVVCDSSISPTTGLVFYDCEDLQTVTFAHADIHNMTSMQLMFAYSGIKEFVLAEMFEGCKLSQVTDMQQMLFECDKLTKVDFSGADLPNLTTIAQMCGYSDNGVKGNSDPTISVLQTANFSNVKFPNVTTVSSLFHRCGALEELSFYNAKLGNVTDLEKIFGNDTYMGYHEEKQLSALTTVDFSNADLHSVTTLAVSNNYGMLSACPNLETVNFSYADLSGVTNVINMFYGQAGGMASRAYSATNLKQVDFSHANLSSLEIAGTSSYGMFNGCTSLEIVDFYGTILPSLADTSRMFYRCSALTTVYLWDDLSKLTTTDSMFYSCSKLANIYVKEDVDLSTQITSGSSMFYGCNVLFWRIFPNESSNSFSYSSAFNHDYAKTGEGGCFTVKQ